MKNWIVVGFWLFLLMMAFSISSRAADLGIRGGAGIVNNQATGAVKLFSVREEGYLGKFFYDGKEFGGWVDNLGAGRKSSFFAKYGAGLKPGPEVGLYGKAFISIAALSDTDSQLGGNFQFSEDFGVGLRDEGSYIDITYSHFSSAGIFRPNAGRDFVLLSTGVRW